MKLHEQGLLLRIFIGESDKYQGKPLYEAIVHKAKELEMAGATVIRGMSGFGARSKLHTSKFLRLSADMPLIVEIVDSEAYIQRLLPFLDEAVQDGMITLEKVQVIKYKSGKNGS
jgi:PII-like signaling protein